ncbi:MAG: GtrA family protein [Saprospiraceae bacterium]|nr:GtrA family protein [Saprospiraceae bacterium]
MFKIKLPEQIQEFIVPKIKFASTSLLATIIDYTIYLCLVYSGFNKVYSNITSASIGFLVNFFLQKKFIFTLRRKAHQTFLISMSFSATGIGISTVLIYLFNKNAFLDHHQYLTKLLVMGIMFLYNFYTKRLAFEKTLKA